MQDVRQVLVNDGHTACKERVEKKKLFLWDYYHLSWCPTHKARVKQARTNGSNLKRALPEWKQRRQPHGKVTLLCLLEYGKGHVAKEYYTKPVIVAAHTNSDILPQDS